MNLAPPKDYNTEFKNKIKERLKNNDVSDTSIKQYIRSLEILNDDEPLKNWNFLKDVENIKNKISDLKENTQRNRIIAICAVLNLYKNDVKPLKALYPKYYEILMELNQKLKKEENKNIKTEKQEKNWLEWQEVEKVFNDLKDKVNKFKNNKNITETQYNTLLAYVVLSLYVLLPPRRNKDYLLMLIVKGEVPDDYAYNYFNLENNKMIFNNFKVVKTEGQQEIEIPQELREIINLYLKIRGVKINKKMQTPLLVDYKGEALKYDNSITYILNRIFKKKIGSSMLRHIYLSSKYGETLKEMKDDSKMMAHSVSMQKDYIKNDEPEIKNIKEKKIKKK